MEQLKVVETKGIRALTTKQLAQSYDVEEKQIKQNFANNKSRFIEGKHYLVLSEQELKAFKNKVENFDLVGKNANKLYLWTEKGALLHAKSLNTDKAWEVYDYLVDFYFRVKENKEEKKEITPMKINTPKLENIRPATGNFVNIPENKEAQNLIAEMRKYLVGMESLLDIYNMYLSQEDFEQVAGTLDKMSSKISRTAHFLQFLKPEMVTKYL